MYGIGTVQYTAPHTLIHEPAHCTMTHFNNNYYVHEAAHQPHTLIHT